jgi:hypothetical protein
MPINDTPPPVDLSTIPSGSTSGSGTGTVSPAEDEQQKIQDMFKK